MSAPDDFTSQLAAAFDAGFDAPGLSPDGPHRAGLRAVEALVRADERDRIAARFFAMGWRPLTTEQIAAEIARGPATVHPDMTGCEQRQLDAMEADHE